MAGVVERARTEASAAQLTTLGAPVTLFVGPAVETIRDMVTAVPRKGSLALAYIDPYKLEYLSFSIFEALAEPPNVDLAGNFSTMTRCYATPISSRKRDGALAHPRYRSARLRISLSLARVMATKQLRRSSSISGLSSPFCLLWYEGN